ncbi:MAG: hypothetical protein J6R82_02100, partial [Clostridia bacterium]|nr:hypothetical protein [Clostridia bacterium]
ANTCGAGKCLSLPTKYFVGLIKVLCPTFFQESWQGLGQRPKMILFRRKSYEAWSNESRAGGDAF